jgi:hypothetical protein
MLRARRWLVLAAGAAAAAFPFLTAGAGLDPRTAAAAWLAAGCLLVLAMPPGRAEPLELALLAAVLAPGLYAALAAAGQLPAANAWLLSARALLALGLHATLAELARRLPARLRAPARLLSALGVTLLFAFWLWDGSLATAAALPACAAAVLLLVRRAHA